MKKRICKKCDRLLQESIHDKCMFCGESIPEHLRLSDERKEEIRKKAEEREKKRQLRKTNTESQHSYIGILGSGGDFGDC